MITFPFCKFVDELYSRYINVIINTFLPGLGLIINTFFYIGYWLGLLLRRGYAIGPP